MGKSQGSNPVTTASPNCSSPAMEVDPQSPEWKGICKKYKTPFLSACHDKVHLQEQPIIGSPPPKGPAANYWEDPESHLNLRLEIPNLVGDPNQNTSECDGKNQQEQQVHNNDQDMDSDRCESRPEVMELSNSVGDMRLQPIIVCENVDDSNDQDSTNAFQEEDEILTLSVPAVDVINEKKRPPISGSNA